MENPSPYNATEDNELTLREQIAIYARHWPWFIIAVLISLTVAYLYLRYTIPSYQSTTSILIKESQGSGAASEMAIFEDLGMFSGMNTNSIENEVEILKSKRLLTNVVTELNLNIRYFKEGNIITSEVYGNKPFTVSILNTNEDFPFPDYPLNFTPTSASTLTITDPEKNTEMEVGFGERVSLSFANITIVPNSSILDDPENFINEPLQIVFSDVAKVVSHYQSNIQITPTDKNGSVIELSLNDPVKEKAEEILDELVVQYNKDAIEDRNLIASNTAAFIEERLDIITAELDSVETGKVTFKQENRLTNIEAEAQLFLEGASEYNSKQLELATQLKVTNDVIDYIKEGTATTLIPANLGISEEGTGGLIGNYNALVLERNRLMRSSTEENPVVKNLDNQINQLRANVLSGLNNVRNSLEIGIRDIRRQENIFDSKISQVPGTEKQFRGIERQQGIKEALYLFLLQKREETSISLAVTAPKAKVIDAAYSSNVPVSPKRNIVLLAALILGLLIPFLILYVHRLLYDKVRNRKDVERQAGVIPILGEVPKVASSESELIGLNDRSILAESFRILRTNLQYLFVKETDETQGKTIFVTSTVKGEGKTFMAVNLALTLANSGKKVILVGADIRNPQLHRYIEGAKTQQGITDFLVSNSLQLEDLIKVSTLKPEFDLLFSGTIPPNPAELWLGKRTPQIFEALKMQYEYVIVDTAPAMLVTDTFLISHYADVTLYVIRADYTERKLLEFPIDAVADNKLQHVAFILNNVKMSNFGYGNKYGYTYSSEKKSFFERHFGRR